MPVLIADFATKVPFSRPTESAFGDMTTAALGDTPAVVSIQTGSVSLGDGPGYTQAGVVFTPRNLDRREGDTFVYNGATYVLVGARRGDHPQPFTGDDFGWVVHSIKRLP